MGDVFRRIVTGHDDNGAAVVYSDTQVALDPFPGMDAKGTVAWSTGSGPADNANDRDGDKRDAGVTLKSGSVLRVTELGPGFASPMHRTLSIDYLVVLSGACEIELDGGEAIRLFAGDVLVQRGTNHRWRNPSADIPCRFVVSMIEAQPISIQGKVLEQTL